jgi:hypothetical protein
MKKTRPIEDHISMTAACAALRSQQFLKLESHRQGLIGQGDPRAG